MAPRQRLSKRQQQRPVLGSGNATVITQPTDTTALETDPIHSGTGSGLSALTITSTSTQLPPSSSSKGSLNDQDPGLSIPVIIGLSVGIFVFLAVILVTVMCLLGRRKLRKEKRSWKSLDNSEKADRAPRHVSSFIGLRTSIPNSIIPNPFTSDSPTSDRRVPFNSVSDNTMNKNPGIFVGSTTKSYTPKVHFTEMDTRAPAPLNFFKANRDPATALQAKVPSLKTKHPRHNSAASTYLNLSDDEEESPKQIGSNTKLPSMPLPAVLSRPYNVGIGLPSNPRASHKPLSNLPRNDFSSPPHPTVTAFSSSSRPAMAALITALDAVPLDVAVPPSASSYATVFTALAAPPASMRTSMVERPATMTFDPLDESSDVVDTTKSMEAARPETLTIDPHFKGGNSSIAKSDDSMGSVLSNASQVQAGLDAPTLLRPGWASTSDYGYGGMGARGSTLTFASSEFEPTRDSLDVRRRGSEDSRT